MASVAAIASALVLAMLAIVPDASATPKLPRIDMSTADRCDFIASPGNRVCPMPFDSVEDLRATGAVPINHIGRYKRRRPPTVLIDAKTGERAPIWAEIDSNATSRRLPSRRYRSRYR